ncbi:hypothetical protein DENSPDRAFT_852411 [Dentipellis sp. KUC8613]|nr:hypothetical protein DENSPDRAFT_852411 [Dentipellis sp. KUC8613]
MTTHASPSSTQGDRPERSRNAKAQARHRAKRKAYIEQLEQTVTKLQSVLALTPEQVAALPPPSARIRQLEQENDKLLRENDELRRQLHLQSRRASLVTNEPHFDIARRTSYPSASNDGHGYDRDLKRRRMSQSVDDVYLSPSETPSPQTTEAMTRPNHFSPPPLQPLPYMSSSSANTSAYSSPGLTSSTSLLSSNSSLHGPLGYQMASHHSSSTSSPTTYSAKFRILVTSCRQQPGHEQNGHPMAGVAGQQQMHQRAVQPAMHAAVGHGLCVPQYSYDSVKVEDDHYISPTNESPQNIPYPHSMSSYGAQPPELNSWHAYSADRTQIHH